MITKIKCGQTTSVNTEWENFSKAVFIGVEPSAIQLQEMERSFYAGFYSCLAIFSNQIAELDEDGGVNFLNKLDNECETYFSRLIAVHRNEH